MVDHIRQTHGKYFLRTREDKWFAACRICNIVGSQAEMMHHVSVLHQPRLLEDRKEARENASDEDEEDLDVSVSSRGPSQSSGGTMVSSKEEVRPGRELSGAANTRHSSGKIKSAMKILENVFMSHPKHDKKNRRSPSSSSSSSSNSSDHSKKPTRRYKRRQSSFSSTSSASSSSTSSSSSSRLRCKTNQKRRKLDKVIKNSPSSNPVRPPPPPILPSIKREDSRSPSRRRRVSYSSSSPSPPQRRRLNLNSLSTTESRCPPPPVLSSSAWRSETLKFSLSKNDKPMRRIKPHTDTSIVVTPNLKLSERLPSTIPPSRQVSSEKHSTVPPRRKVAYEKQSTVPPNLQLSSEKQSTVLQCSQVTSEKSSKSKPVSGLSNPCFYCGERVGRDCLSSHTKLHVSLTWRCRKCDEQTRYLYCRLSDLHTHLRLRHSVPPSLQHVILPGSRTQLGALAWVECQLCQYEECLHFIILSNCQGRGLIPHTVKHRLYLVWSNWFSHPFSPFSVVRHRHRFFCFIMIYNLIYMALKANAI